MTPWGCVVDLVHSDEVHVKQTVDLDSPHQELEAKFQAVSVPKPDELTLRTCLNEAWFSDTLSWLLDPSGSHKLGKQFLQEFLKTVAEKRKDEPRYTQGKPHLLYGTRQPAKDKARTVSRLSLGNASVHREFFLSKGLRKTSKSSAFCDVVVLDLDPADGLFLVVENKLFTQNHKGQLEAYFQRVEQRYNRAPVREYVYLTPRGETPKKAKDEAWAHPNWVRMSWLVDVLGLLEGLVSSRCHPRVHELIKLLCWMKSIAEISNRVGRRGEFAHSLLETTAEFLLAELNWLCGHDNPKSTGRKWSVKKVGRQQEDSDDDDPPIARRALQFSSTQSQALWLELLPSYAIGLQSRSRGQQAKFEKLIVPFGAQSDQVFNLLEVTARDIYGLVLAKPSVAVKQGRWKRGKTRRKAMRSLVEECRDVFDFLHVRRFELRVLFGLAGLNSESSAQGQGDGESPTTEKA